MCLSYRLLHTIVKQKNYYAIQITNKTFILNFVKQLTKSY